MEFLDIKVFDDDIYKLLFRFAVNFAFLFIAVRMIYYAVSRKKQYVFSYIMINVLVFLICFTLKKFELQLGMALGLFALFGILRYRTDAIPIREMTYLFVVIGLGVMNALANKKMSYVEIFLTNGIIVGILFGLEWSLGFGREVKKKIVYEKIALIHPVKRKELILDLEDRTGLAINRVEVGSVDFLRDTANISIYYDRFSEEALLQNDEGEK
ncbi:MAG TPA: DUF4956 domain-containing protein [Bacteroidetes bacterium]|nr:DUF4956 domain-containing protein [Bacteroidota bacterium]